MSEKEPGDSRLNPQRSKLEEERFCTPDVSQRFLIARVQEQIPQFEPAAQARRSARCRTRPASSREGSGHANEGGILSNHHQRDAGAFGEGQFEIALLRKSHQHFAD